MKSTKIILLALICASIFFLANSNGVTTVQSLDRTGSPLSSQHCTQCHNSGAFAPTITLRLKDGGGNLVTTYDPGQTYTFEVEVAASGAAAFGFQAVALLSGNVNAGTMTASGNAKTVSLNSRTYAEHNGASVGNGLFSMTWVAPAAGSGTVNFYAAGNSVNDNNASSGDQGIVAAPLTITENSTTSIEEKTSLINAIYPNPVQDMVTIETHTSVSSAEIIDANGRIVRSMQLFGTKHLIDMSSLESGLYSIRILAEGRMSTSTLVKE